METTSTALAFSVTVNGRLLEKRVEPRQLLLHFLRDDLGLTGTHCGCETSICGACTVLLDGKTVKSCTILSMQADGCRITTIEGLAGEAAAGEGRLHPVQEAFHQCHGLQCGFCTPGMILSAAQLLSRCPDPTEQEIRKGIEGNLCRCTGYQHIIQAVRQAAGKPARDSVRGKGV